MLRVRTFRWPERAQTRRGRDADGSQIKPETGTCGLRAEPNLRPAAVLLAANDNQLAARSHDSLGPISRVVLTLVLLTLWIGVFFARLFSP